MVDPQALRAIQELVVDVARTLVDDPDRVQVRMTEAEEAITFHLSVAPNDVGKIIGKQGRTARSIRTIIGGASARLHVRLTLDIVEPWTAADQKDARRAA